MGRVPKKAEKGQHYPSEILNIYLTPQNEVDEEVIGVAELIELQREADPTECYILPDEEKHNVARSLEYWTVRFIIVTSLGEFYNYSPGLKYIKPIPIIFSTGRVMSGFTTLKQIAGQNSYKLDYGMTDNFEGVPGWGQQF